MVLPHVRHVLRHWCPFDPFQLMRGWVQEACCAALAASVLAVACELFGILLRTLLQSKQVSISMCWLVPLRVMQRCSHVVEPSAGPEGGAAAAAFGGAGKAFA